MRAQVVDKALQVALDAQRQKIGELYEMRMAQSLSWTIAASAQAARLVTGAVRTGRPALVQVAGRSKPVDALEIVGLA
jgi:hypothetical protein